MHWEYFKDLMTTFWKESSTPSDIPLSAFMESEDVHYLRIHSNLIRQSQRVKQSYLHLVYSAQGAQIKQSLTLTGQKLIDMDRLKRAHENLNNQISLLPSKSKQSWIKNLKSTIQIDKHVNKELWDWEKFLKFLKDYQVFGLLNFGTSCLGYSDPSGLFHFFEKDFGYFDYTIFNKPSQRPIKGIFYFDNPQVDDFQQHFENQLAFDSFLTKTPISISRGSYRCYLSPLAISELFSTIAWQGFSYEIYKKGLSPFKKWFDQQLLLNPDLTVQENFSFNLAPRFNSMGNLSPNIVPLIQKGRFKQFLVSDISAAKYEVESNHAESGIFWGFEMPRSLEILPGLLPESQVLQSLDEGLWIGGLHYVNWTFPEQAQLTGMTRYQCFYVKNGSIQGPIDNFRFELNLYDFLGSDLEALTNSNHVIPVTHTYDRRHLGAIVCPGFLVKKFDCVLPLS